MIARPLSGETCLEIAGLPYILRPSFGALYDIEQQFQLSLPAIIALLADRPVMSALLRTIAHTGLLAAGEHWEPEALTDNFLTASTPTLRTFLLRGIGCNPAPDIDTPRPTPLDWADIFKTYVGIMGRTPQDFWCITLAEYLLAVEGFCLLHNVDTFAAAAPATSHDLAELLQRFPDGR